MVISLQWLFSLFLWLVKVETCDIESKLFKLLKNLISGDLRNRETLFFFTKLGDSYLKAKRWVRQSVVNWPFFARNVGLRDFRKNKEVLSESFRSAFKDLCALTHKHLKSLLWWEVINMITTAVIPLSSCRLLGLQI